MKTHAAAEMHIRHCDYVILSCDKTLKSYFGKLGSAGNSGECKAVISNVFSGL